MSSGTPIHIIPRLQLITCEDLDPREIDGGGPSGHQRRRVVIVRIYNLRDESLAIMNKFFILRTVRGMNLL